MLTVSADTLKKQIAVVFETWGMPADYIADATRVMVETDLRGIDSHGIGMLPGYHRMRKQGNIVVDGPITTVMDLPSIGVLDGGHGLGHPVAIRAMTKAIEKAQATGVGVVVARNSGHYGAAGYYAYMAAEQGLIGISMTATPGGAVVPTFSRGVMFGTNPIAFAAPTKRNKPFLLDMATSTVAIGKLNIARRKGEPIPVGWAVDQEGKPITDPVEAVATRLLTPLGGTREQGSHKGYGLAAMVDILSRTLSGAFITRIVDPSAQTDERSGIGHFFMALDPAAFREAGAFQDDLDDLIDALHALPRVDENQPVLVAGDPEYASYDERVKNGIPMTATLVEEVRTVALESNAAFLLAD